MPYEIPAEIAYEEKIIFGLTFKQLFYCLIFSPVALAILLKTPFSLYVRISLALIPSGLCAVFIFTNLPKLAWDWYRWLSWREFAASDAKMKQYIELKKIDGALVYAKNKYSIIKVEPINFSIRDTEEKDVTIKSFQKFLNSLDFPIQIIIATDTINLDQYINNAEIKAEAVAEKTKTQKYNTLFKSYKEHLQETISKNSLLNRSFYLVVPGDGSLRLGVCCDLLRGLGLRHTILKDDELKQTLAGFFNDMYKDKTTTNLLEAVAPKRIINKIDYIIVDDKYTRTIAVRGYPRIVEPGFLDKLITINGDFDLAMHIDPFPIESMLVILNRELQKQRADIYGIKKKGIINPALEIQYKDTRKVMESIQRGDEKLFNFSLYITCKATDLKELDLLTKKIESQLNALLMIPKKLKFRMHQGLKSTTPFARDELKVKRTLPTSALSAFYPFTSQFLQIDEEGIWLGLNRNNIPIIKDLFKLYNINGVVLASSGGGKSYFTKLMISRLLLNGTKVMVVDPQAEYTDLVQRFNGQLVIISKNSETIINPLDLMGHDFDDKKLTLMELFPVMIGDVSEIQKAVLDRALTLVYKKKGITNEPKTWNKEPPIMGELLTQLKTMAKKASKTEQETYRSLMNRIEMYVSGVFSFMNKQTRINFDNHFVCFNIGNMPGPVKPVVMFLILDYVYMKMRKDIERKILVIDEAWSLLERTQDEGYIFRIVKTCRKYNMGLLLITQDVADLISNKAGQALLNNSEYTLLLRQKPAIIKQIEKTFQLSQQEQDRLLTAKAGEGVIIISNEHSEIKVIASPEEHQIITTNADERLKQEMDNARAPEQEFVKQTPVAEQDTGYYKKADLNSNDVQQLLDKGYILSEHVGLLGGRRDAYLLRPRYNESPDHFFVTKAIEAYLRQFTDKVLLYETTKPDIVFEADGKQVGIEVETGKRYVSDRKAVEQKVRDLNAQYSDWFFVVINASDDKPKYAALGSAFSRREVPAVIKNYFKPQQSKSATISPETPELSLISNQNTPGNNTPQA